MMRRCVQLLQSLRHLRLAARQSLRAWAELLVEHAVHGCLESSSDPS